MKILTTFLLFALCASLAFGALPKYTFKDLGTLGGANSYAYAINDQGQVIGRADNAAGQRRAVLFDVTGNGANKDLGTLAGSNGDSWAYAINNTGKIVGHDYDAYGTERAVLFDITGLGNNISLGSLGGGAGGAQAINDDGTIVGWAATTPDEYYYSNWHAAKFDPTGAGDNIDLDQSDCYLSVARCISSLGDVAGNSEESATLFDDSGQAQNFDLGSFFTGDFSTVLAINDSGQMVGYGNTQPGYYHHAMLFSMVDEAATALDLGGLGGLRSYAISINKAGQIVGYSRTASGAYRATWFDPNGTGQNIDLNTVIDPALGYELNSAYINDSGQICGYAKTPAGQTHAYLLTPVVDKPVLKTVSVKVTLTPASINTAAKLKWVMLNVQMPKTYKTTDIDIATIKLDGIATPDWTYFTKNSATGMARFTTTSLAIFGQPGTHDLTFTADSRDVKVRFMGKVKVKIIGKAVSK